MLPDKGEKIKNFRDRVLLEIERQNEIEKAAELLSKLNIASQGKAAMNEMEWTGKYSEKSNYEKIVELDSDDDDDPIKILAQVKYEFQRVSRKKITIQHNNDEE